MWLGTFTHGKETVGRRKNEKETFISGKIKNSSYKNCIYTLFLKVNLFFWNTTLESIWKFKRNSRNFFHESYKISINFFRKLIAFLKIRMVHDRWWINTECFVADMAVRTFAPS